MATRVAVQVIPPVPLVWLRYVTAMGTLFIFGQLAHVSWKIKKEHWKLLAGVGLIGYTFSIVTQETGTMLTSAQTGSIVTASTPAFMVIFARIWLKERLTAGRVLSVVLASIGVLLIVADPDNFQITGWEGGVCLMTAAVTWAVMSVWLKLLPGYSPITLTFYGVLTAVVVLALPALSWIGQADAALFAPAEIWGSVLYMGIISTSCGFVLWNKGLLYMDASIGGLFLFFQPLVGTFLGWVLLGEPITLYFWLGSALIVGGVVLAMRS